MCLQKFGNFFKGVTKSQKKVSFCYIVSKVFQNISHGLARKDIIFFSSKSSDFLMV